MKAKSRFVRTFSLTVAAGALSVGAAQAGDNSQIPSIQSLLDSSDYSVLMQRDVPESVRIQALRALFQNDPANAGSDGLTDYEDNRVAAAQTPVSRRKIAQIGGF